MQTVRTSDDVRTVCPISYFPSTERLPPLPSTATGSYSVFWSRCLSLDLELYGKVITWSLKSSCNFGYFTIDSSLICSFLLSSFPYYGALLSPHLQRFFILSYKCFTISLVVFLFTYRSTDFFVPRLSTPPIYFR